MAFSAHFYQSVVCSGDGQKGDRLGCQFFGREFFHSISDLPRGGEKALPHRECSFAANRVPSMSYRRCTSGWIRPPRNDAVGSFPARNAFRVPSAQDRTGFAGSAKAGPRSQRSGEPQSGVSTDAALLANDGTDPAFWNADGLGQSVLEMPPGLRNSSKRTSPGWTLGSRLVFICILNWFGASLVIIGDLRFSCPVIGPAETEPIFVIDPISHTAPCDHR